MQFEILLLHTPTREPTRPAAVPTLPSTQLLWKLKSCCVPTNRATSIDTMIAMFFTASLALKARAYRDMAEQSQLMGRNIRKLSGTDHDLCGHSCSTVVNELGIDCADIMWDVGCPGIEPPQGMTGSSDGFELCPETCPSNDGGGDSGGGQSCVTFANSTFTVIFIHPYLLLYKALYISTRTRKTYRRGLVRLFLRSSEV